MTQDTMHAPLSRFDEEKQALLKKISNYAPSADMDLLASAFDYGCEVHKAQKRASGEPYFLHPVAVANILADMKMDEATIATGLLHDTVEDTRATREGIEKQFGPKIGELVDGVTKIEQFQTKSKEARKARDFQKLLLAVSSDIRVLLVKLADRLHNMRTLEFVSEEKKRRISQETLEIYAPLAERMGIQWLREELEEHCFRWLHPDGYKMVQEKLARLRKKNEGRIRTIRTHLQKALEERGITAKVFDREKKPFSIWRKLEQKQIAFEQLADIYAFRIITKNTADCYAALGIVHTTWHLVPGYFRDYISLPKQNGYQSIHTKIAFDIKEIEKADAHNNDYIELQIRTEEMHKVAELGVAAHAVYKETPHLAPDKIAKKAEENKAYQWLRELVETLQNHDNPEAFLEDTKKELFKEQVFCFTPKGGLIALPHNATPLDFAYAVHTDVGDTFVGAKVNGYQAHLKTRLRNGDVVEIIRSPNHVPKPEWEKIVVTGKAKSGIRRATREAEQKEMVSLGRQLLELAFENHGHKFRESRLNAYLEELGYSSAHDIYIAVGNGQIPAIKILEIMELKSPDHTRRTPVQRKENGWFGIGKSMLKFRWPTKKQNTGTSSAASLPIRGSRGELPIRFAPNGGAIPGDRIIGIQEPGSGITIYPVQSAPLEVFDSAPDHIIDVTWDIDKNSTELFPCQIEVSALNRPGTLVEIAEIISRHKANIDNLKMVNKEINLTVMRIDLEVLDSKHLGKIIKGLNNLPTVTQAIRTYKSRDE